MCGIAGILNFNSQQPSLSDMKKMLAVLAVRGPDDSGTWGEQEVLFGHRRLAVIDLSNQAHQPMVDDATALIFNGTIYNHLELRKELQAKGFVFKSHSDTEVIAKAYQAWGLECVPKLSGMFAFALWDRATKLLHLVRDRFGIKPLYYSKQNDCLIFASNPQAIIKSGKISSQLDLEALHFHFSLHAVVPAPRTILRQIRKVKPAHILSFNMDKSSEKRYWQLNSLEVKRDDLEWQQLTLNALRQAVKRRIQNADVPVGVLLSGGLDSSILVGLLAEQGAKNLQTFSVGFEDDVNEKGNEFTYSDSVADKFQTQHHKISVANREVLKKLPDAIANMAEPMFGQDAVAFYLLSEQVSKHVKVVQSGQGADEVFAGYFWYQKMLTTSSNIDQQWKQFHYNYVDRDHYEMTTMLQKPVPNITQQWLKQQFSNILADSFLAKVLNLDVCNLIVDDPVKRVDNMTMAWGLEARVPFLDHQLVELVATMPDRLKLAQGGKGILKTIARGIIPDIIIDRPKAYFPMPALKYIRGDFLIWIKEILLSNTARQRGLYQPKYVEKLLSQPTEHFTRINGSKLWHLALTEAWLQTHGW